MDDQHADEGKQEEHQPSSLFLQNELHPNYYKNIKQDGKVKKMEGWRLHCDLFGLLREGRTC